MAEGFGPLPPIGRTIIGGFETTLIPAADIDVAEATEHDLRWRSDIDSMAAAGVRHLRYPVRWHRVERERGTRGWSETDRVFEYFSECGIVPIVDLVHHTSYPTWLTDGFRDRRFASAFVDFAEAVAIRYPQITAYTLFNEPFATLFLAGHEALWPPYDSGIAGFVRLARSVLPAVSQAAQCWAQLLPTAQHVWVDTAEHHTGTNDTRNHVELANDRRHSCLDLFLGTGLDPERPFLRELLAAGGESLFELPPGRVDMLGLDYYSHSEWFYDHRGAHAPSPRPVGFAAVAEHYWQRYGLPMALTETNVRGLPTDRVTWLRYMLDQYERALERGLPLHGFCWFPHIDSCDWDSLLARAARRIDPVGVYSLGASEERLSTIFTTSWKRAVRGAPAADLPAYRLQPPCGQQLAALTATLTDWPWEDAPTGERRPPTMLAQAPTITVVCPSSSGSDKEDGVRTSTPPDLIVLSHLRWGWVWQRPQHIVSRLAARRAAQGACTWFIEEPLVVDGVARPQLRTERVGDLTRVWLAVPPSPDMSAGRHIGFADPGARPYADLLVDLLASRNVTRDVWVYTPMANDIATRLEGDRVVYDVMDDLASFREAPAGLRQRQRRLIYTADLVFTGGRSLHRAVTSQRQGGVHLFPSGVDASHYAASRQLRQRHPRPVAGYVGVIDERLDLLLLRELAALLPDWDIHVIGPVAKIEVASLPRAENLRYPGMVDYAELPQLMAGLDVALMPFALNEATHNISPTKTLEYLAAGLPVVSTRVPDVLADYERVVHFADDAPGFATACRHLLTQGPAERDSLSAPLIKGREWDTIVARMTRLMGEPAPTFVDGTEEQPA